MLSVVIDEINDGAGEVLRAIDRTSPIGRLLHSAATVLGRAPRGDGKGSTSKTRLRGKKTATVLTTVVAATAELQTRPTHDAEPEQWVRRLIKIAEVWGDRWVLRQAVATLPISVDLSAAATAIDSEQPALKATLETEAEVRANRNNTAWWRAQLTTASTPPAARHWLFSVLTCAHTQVVIDLATEIGDLVDGLAPKHYQSIRAALRHFQTLGNSRELVLYDPIRLNQVTFSPATLWLLRTVVTDASVDQIDQRLTTTYPDLLDAGLGDLREVTRVVGTHKTIPFTSFRNHRASLPGGGWASNIKLGAMRGNVAGEVLANPAAWPSDLVQRSVERVEEGMLADLKPLADAAEDEHWFAGDQPSPRDRSGRV